MRARESAASCASPMAPRAEAKAIARPARAASWQVKLLVEATATSRPALVCRDAVGLARDGAVRHVDQRHGRPARGAGRAQGRERVGGLAGLRHEQRCPALPERRCAIAELRGDIGLGRQAGDPLEPVFGDHGRVEGAAAGDHRQAGEAARIERQLGGARSCAWAG